MNGVVLRRAGVALLVVLVLGATVLIAVRIPRTLSMFLIAALIAFGASPLVAILERRMARAAAIAVVYLGLLGAFTVGLVVIVPITYAQILSLAAHAGEYVAASQSGVTQLEAFMRSRFGSHVQLPTFDQVAGEVGARVGAIFTVTIESIGAILVNAFNAMLVGMSALILSIFFLARVADVRRGVLGLVPPSRRTHADGLLVEVASIFGHFVGGQLALCALVGALVFLFLAPAHFAFSLLVAMICAFGYAIPFFGMIVAQLAALVLAIPQGPGMVLYVSVAIFVIARIADNVLVPKVLGDSVGVSPIGVMFAVFAGGELFGLWGLVLAIPTAALIRVLFRTFVRPWIDRIHGRDTLPAPTGAGPLIEVTYADAS